MKKVYFSVKNFIINIKRQWSQASEFHKMFVSGSSSKNQGSGWGGGEERGGRVWSVLTASKGLMAWNFPWSAWPPCSLLFTIFIFLWNPSTQMLVSTILPLFWKEFSFTYRFEQHLKSNMRMSLESRRSSSICISLGNTVSAPVAAACKLSPGTALCHGLCCPQPPPPQPSPPPLSSPFPCSSSSSIYCPVSDCPSACDPEARGHRAWSASAASEAMAAVVKSKYMVDPDNAFNLIKWVLTWQTWILLFDILYAALNNAVNVSNLNIFYRMEKWLFEA